MSASWARAWGGRVNYPLNEKENFHNLFLMGCGAMPKKSIPPDGNVFQGVRTIVHVPAAKREKFLRRGRKWL